MGLWAFANPLKPQVPWWTSTANSWKGNLVPQGCGHKSPLDVVLPRANGLVSFLVLFRATLNLPGKWAANEFSQGLLGSWAQREATVRGGRIEGRNTARRPFLQGFWPIVPSKAEVVRAWGEGRKPFFLQKRKCRCCEHSTKPHSNKSEKGTRLLKCHFHTWRGWKTEFPIHLG